MYTYFTEAVLGALWEGGVMKRCLKKEQEIFHDTLVSYEMYERWLKSNKRTDEIKHTQEIIKYCEQKLDEIYPQMPKRECCPQFGGHRFHCDCGCEGE